MYKTYEIVWRTGDQSGVFYVAAGSKADAVLVAQYRLRYDQDLRA